MRAGGRFVRIFVTGANGFIGSHFMDHAAAAGHYVIGLHRANGHPP